MLLAVGVGVSVAASSCSGCGKPPAPEEKSAESASPAAAQPQEPYTAPPEGTATLVKSVSAKRDAGGQIMVTGAMALPLGTRTWVELYAPTAAPGSDPIGRSELYLMSGGAFEAGPFKATGNQFRVVITSHFNRDWQPRDVLASIGTNGIKLPKSALKLLRPGAPQYGGYLEYSTNITVGG
jgi:hypothetical protein